MSDKLAEIAKASAKGSFHLFWGDAFSTAILAVGSILIARLLGPGEYGIYSLTLVVPTLLNSLISLGIDQSLVRFPAKLIGEGRNSAAVRILKSGLKFRLLTGLGMSAICFILSDFFAIYLLNRPEAGFYLRMASLVIFFQAIFGSVYYSFVGVDEPGRSALIKLLMSLGKASIAFILVVFGLGVAGAIAGHVLGYALAGALGVLLLMLGPYRKLGHPGSGKGGSFLNDLRLMLGYGFPLYISSIALILIGQYQLILLSHFVSNQDIGNFAAAMNPTVLLQVLLVPISTALFPAFSKLDPIAEKAALQRFFKLSIKSASLIMVPTSIVLMLLSAEVIHILYGPSYKPAAVFLSLYVVLFLFTGLGYGIVGSFFNGLGETKLTLRVNLLNAGIFAPLSLPLTKLYGVLGMIFALLISNLASTLYGLWLAKSRFGASPSLNDQSRIYLASALSAISLLMFLKLTPLGDLPNVVLGAGIFAVAYLTLLPLLGGIHKHDIQNLETGFSGLRTFWLILKPVLAYENKLARNNRDRAHP